MFTLRPGPWGFPKGFRFLGIFASASPVPPTPPTPVVVVPSIYTTEWSTSDRITEGFLPRLLESGAERGVETAPITTVKPDGQVVSFTTVT